MSQAVIGVIPARWESTRFPGKMLHPVAGKPLVQWVIEGALRAKRLDRVVVATNHQPIVDLAWDCGAEGVLTRTDHPSGTDRVAEAAAGYAPRAVINIQGDEVMIDPELIDQLAQSVCEEGWDMATAATPIRDAAELAASSVVKVVTGGLGRALYFSRAPIPCFRDETPEDALAAGLHFRHLGIYAFDMATLERFIAEPPSALEQAEKLEQLRALHLGVSMQVLRTDAVGPGVDLPEDVAVAEAALREAGMV